MKTPWASIAKIKVDGIHSGTGFPVTERHILTAFHVVGEPETGAIGRDIKVCFFPHCEFDDNSPPVECLASVLEERSSVKHDFALLECREVPKPARPLPLSDQCHVFVECSSPGFAIEKPNGFAPMGKVASLNEPMKREAIALGLQFDFGGGVRMKGHSGAPVLVNGMVVGLLRTAFLDEAEKTIGGILHAARISDVIAHSGGLLTCAAVSAMAALPPPAIRWPQSVPPERTPILANRKEEFQIFEEMITGQRRERVLLLQGTSDSGKTKLCNELRARAKQLGLLHSSVDLKGCPTKSEIFHSLQTDIGSAILGSSSRTDGDGRFCRLIDDFRQLAQPAVLFFDTWEKSSHEMRDWIEKQFLPRLDKMPGVVVLIGGQEVPDPEINHWGDVAVHRPLGPIKSTDDWFDYTQRKWPGKPVNRHHVEALALAADGNPGAIYRSLVKVLEGLRTQTQSAGGAL